MKVLITGANGFIGKNLRARLSQVDENIIIYYYDIETPKEKLEEFTKDCDFVYNFAAVQAKVNQLASGASAKKSVAEVAKEVLAGKWGNGADRKARLTAEGYDYEAVQNAVNAKLKADQEEWHTVRSGETLTSIAEDFNTTVSALVKLNGIKNPNMIYVNQKIRVK